MGDSEPMVNKSDESELGAFQKLSQPTSLALILLRGS